MGRSHTRRRRDRRQRGGRTERVFLRNSLTGEVVPVSLSEGGRQRRGQALYKLLPPNMKEVKGKGLKCSPGSRSKVKSSCLSTQTLSVLQKQFNARHPSHPIRAATPEELHQKLVANNPKARVKGETALVEDMPDLKKKTFSPNAPKVWARKPTTWLTSDDIEAVMKQWEWAYPNFDFLGPSPSDYDKLDEFGERVWPELFQFDLNTALHKGRRQFGVIFNLDTHESDGSHWVSMFINANTRSIYFFDSTGEPIPANIRRFVHQVQEDATEMGTAYTFDQNNPVAHQRGNTECGIYSLFFIIMMLQYSDDPAAFGILFKNKEAVIPDSEMVKQRGNFFNRPS